MFWMVDEWHSSKREMGGEKEKRSRQWALLRRKFWSNDQFKERIVEEKICGKRNL